MISRVIIHIGSDKAGSTAIQESLSVNRGWYLRGGVYVPETGFMKMSGHSRLFTNLNSASLRRELGNELREAEQFDVALLSWEGVHFFDTAEREELRSLLELCAPEAKVEFVYYVRNQIDVIQSGVLQQIKQLNLDPAAVEDLNQPLDHISPAGRSLLFNDKRMYHDRVGQWRGTFPTATFRLRLYGREHLVNGDIIDDFHHVIGLQTDDEFERPARLANLSLTAETAVVLKEFSRLVWNVDDRARVVDTLVGYPSGRSDYLFADTRAAMSDYFAADNVRLSAEFPHCAEIRAPRSSPGVSLTTDEVEQCRRYLVLQSSYPTLIGGELAGRDLRHLNLKTGWARATIQGIWTTGARSVIRFRPRGMHFGGYTPGVELNLRGRYAGRRDKTDMVSVNGNELGPIDLTGGPFFVAVEHLGDNYEIELTLDHTIGKRALLKPDPPKAFHLQALLYSVVQ